MVEYLNHSLLVKKSAEGFRSHNLPDLDSTICNIAKWEYIVVMDPTNAFYQVPLSRQFMTHCGVATSFRAVRMPDLLSACQDQKSPLKNSCAASWVICLKKALL